MWVHFELQHLQDHSPWLNCCFSLWLYCRGSSRRAITQLETLGNLSDLLEELHTALWSCPPCSSEGNPVLRKFIFPFHTAWVRAPEGLWAFTTHSLESGDVQSQLQGSVGVLMLVFPPSRIPLSRPAPASLRTSADCVHTQSLRRRMQASKYSLSLCPIGAFLLRKFAYCLPRSNKNSRIQEFELSTKQSFPESCNQGTPSR